MAMPGMGMSGSYDYGLVALSVLLAVMASYSVLELSCRTAAAKGRTQTVWIGCGAVALGMGVWSMHYVGMVAMRLPVAVFYHVPTVLLSLLAAVAASGVALWVVSLPNPGVWPQLAGGLVMGAGIASMHYIGMAAMRGVAVARYDLRIVALSVVLAFGASAAALHMAVRERGQKGINARKIASALAMGVGIASMHYTGMWAATFRAAGVQADGRDSVSAWTISATCLIGLAAALVALFIASFVVQKNDLELAREREVYFHTMAEALPEMLWTADPDGNVDYFNQQVFDYFGLTDKELRGNGWLAVVHSDDAELVGAKWKSALRSGEPYDVEYRLRGRDGSYRWFLCKASPIRGNDGRIVKWFGTSTDIENQKQDQQMLETQIQERTVQLADANARLQEEMLERDYARNALDHQNAKMLQELEARSKRATLLAKMGEHLQSCISRDEVFAAALGFAPKIFPTTRGAIALLNSSRTHAEIIGSWAECMLPKSEFEPTACWALRTGQPHLVLENDFTAVCPHAVGVKHTYLCVPILAQGETLGILHLQATDEVPQLNSAELSFNTTFAGQVGLSIANIRLREALRTQSVRDALTGLYNRRYLEEVLDREIRRAGRAVQSMGILMLDLDHFKQFNDTYGHDAGDTVLREAASFLVKNVRAEDFVCRYGGEEFVVILPTADLEGARSRAERLRTKMKEVSIVYQGQTLRMVTFSMGLAEFPLHGTTAQELMAAADAALYEAKRNGRDQVVVARAAEAAQTPEAAGASA
jgi:diguanylate cyclase (GGDEF)-like protein/PAS domain S-box-containing protein